MKLKVFVAVLLFFLGGFVYPFANQAQAADAVSCITAYAHRGNAFYGSPIENSMNAFQTAYATGARWVETDVHFTSDNVPVLMHSATVDATTTGTGAIATMTAQQFTSLTMDDGQHPPTLDQLLNLLRTNTEYKALVELKVVLTTQQQQIMLAKLQGMEEKVSLTAFSNRFSGVQALKQANPLLHTSLLAYSVPASIPAGIDGIDMDYTALTASTVAQLHAMGLKVRAWTPNSSTQWNTLRSYGVDGIITNKVQALVNWLGTSCNSGNPSPITSDIELSLNKSFEQDMTGWSTATTASLNTRVATAYDGVYSARSINTSSVLAKHGLMSRPLDGVNAKTVAGATYTASAWVKPDYVGQTLAIYLRETNGAKVVFGSKTISITAASTDWQQIGGAYVAATDGNKLEYHVFATNSQPQTGFLVDLVTLTTKQ